MSAPRVFESRQAVREKVPLLIGLVGASGSGKTFSALRLAAGLGPDVFVIDSEARRALWYADRFKFQHVDFQAPFGSPDYLAAIEHCVSRGAKTIIIDSMSHEHDGPGGVLEMHDKEQDRLAKLWGVSRDKANMSAWQIPKSQRRQLLNRMLQMPVNFILCFRAKEKINLSGDKPKPMGWMPVAGEEFVYEMSVNCLLYPNAGGVPSWHPEEMGEKAIIKLPGQFKDIFATKAPLSEEIGAKLAQWAAGGAGPVVASTPAPATATAQPASPEQVEEIKVELGRLKWTTKQIREWCATYGGATWPDKIPGDKAISALQTLIAMPDPPG